MRRRPGILFLLALAAGLAVVLWFGHKGLSDMVAKRAEVRRMALENRRLAARNQDLVRRIVRLGKNSEFTLKTIRRELTPLVRPDEIIFLFPADKPRRRNPQGTP
ncbi:MAG: septum formation initiator family protein [Proteobacteria bacterium]|nr:septum formation initiator family protein [Pseudomonadota bacterium]MBU1741568.1 septum formation initiator family protein [Pseudomonadota bacterium]